MKRLILSLFAVCSLWMANAQNPAWGPQSKVVTDSIYSTVLGRPHPRLYHLSAPQSYGQGRADREGIPILYLLQRMWRGEYQLVYTGQRVKGRDRTRDGHRGGVRDELSSGPPPAAIGSCWTGLLQHAGWAYEDCLLHSEYPAPYIEKTYQCGGRPRQHHGCRLAPFEGWWAGTTSYAQRYPDL